MLVIAQFETLGPDQLLDVVAGGGDVRPGGDQNPEECPSDRCGQDPCAQTGVARSRHRHGNALRQGQVDPDHLAPIVSAGGCDADTNHGLDARERENQSAGFKGLSARTGTTAAIPEWCPSVGSE